jgi:hypothetical protein
MAGTRARRGGADPGAPLAAAGQARPSRARGAPREGRPSPLELGRCLGASRLGASRLGASRLGASRRAAALLAAAALVAALAVPAGAQAPWPNGTSLTTNATVILTSNIQPSTLAAIVDRNDNTAWQVPCIDQRWAR